MSIDWNWGIFLQQAPFGNTTYLGWLWSGFQVTVALSITAWIIAFLVGSFFGILRTVPNRFLSGLGTLYVELFRNVPLIVQFFTWYLVIPELLPMVGFAHRNAHHCYDVWTHTAVAVDHVPPRLPLRLAMLLHDMGKPDTFSLGEDGQGHFYGHPRRSVELAEGILTRLRFPRRTREQVLCLVRYHDAVIEESPQRVRRWLNKLGPERFFDLLEIQRGDASAQAPAYCTRLDHLRRLEKIAGEVLAEAPCLTVRELAVGGRELLALGYQGPAIGMALRRLLDCVLEGTLPNEKTALLQYLEQIDAKKSEGKRNKSSGET